MPIALPGGAHLRPQQRIVSDEAIEAEHRLLHRPSGHARSDADTVTIRSYQSLFPEGSTVPHRNRRSDEVNTGRFGEKRNGPARPRIDLENEENSRLNGKLDVEKTLYADLPGDRGGSGNHLRLNGTVTLERRKDARRVA
jgi:hypothetical protein